MQYFIPNVTNFQWEKMNFGPNVYSGSERHMANIIAVHFECYLLRYLCSGSIWGVNNSNFMFSVRLYRKKCIRVLCFLTHWLWISHADAQSVSLGQPPAPSQCLSCSSSPTCGAHWCTARVPGSPPSSLTAAALVVLTRALLCPSRAMLAGTPTLLPVPEPQSAAQCLHWGCNSSHLTSTFQRLEI